MTKKDAALIARAQRNLQRRRAALGIRARGDAGAQVVPIAGERPNGEMAPEPGTTGALEADSAEKPALAHSADDTPAAATDARSKRHKPAKRTISEQPDPTGRWNEIDATLDTLERDERCLRPNYRDTLLPPGTVVTAAAFEFGEWNIGSARKLVALFTISDVPNDPELAQKALGLTLLRSWNPPRTGWLARQHALYHDWLAITGRPLRSIPNPKRWSAKSLLGAFLAEVEVVAETGVVDRRMDRVARKWVATPKGEHYSTITQLIGLSAGCPRVNLRRSL